MEHIMPRDIPVGNGTLLVAFNTLYEICDIYYPHVGMENHSFGYPFRFGVWVDGEFSWVRSDEWKRSLDYQDDTLVTDVRLENGVLGIELQCADCVDFHESVFLRRVTVHNNRSRSRNVRLFFHHDFNISHTDVGDTAYYDPRTNSLVHYKRRIYFLMSSCTETMCGGFQYSTGYKRSARWEGTWRDAEDGTLSGNPIVQGSVDSVMGIECNPEPNGDATIYYWMAAGKSYEDVKTVNSIIHERGPEGLIRRTRDYWRLWIEKEESDLSILPENIQRLYNRSLLILRTQIDNEGAIIAANDTDIFQFGRDTYSYMWPRDGALVARALDIAGYSEPARRFYKFCAGAIHDRGYLLHKYNPDGSPGSSWHPWVGEQGMHLPVQEDETALVIWALWNHFRIYRDIEFIKPLYKPLIKAAADFMLQYRESRTGLPYPSYDLWEERRGILTFTTASVVAGLRAAA
ncbi:MAG: glycoside hydrolase family 15 protein, partial [Candidatus Hydrogenedentota bacterium]